MEKFFGVQIPTITPFDSNGQVNEVQIEKLTRFYIDAGCSCLIPTANNGEQPHLTEVEKKQVWQKTVEAVAGKILVAPSISGNTTAQVIERAKYCESIGADGVMVGPPYYFPLNPDDLYEHYRTIGESINIPIIIHNEPDIFKVDLMPDLVAKLNKTKTICLIKESTYDTTRIHGIIRLCGDTMTVIVAGGATALESLVVGAKAWMTGLNNIIPELAVYMYNLAVVESNWTAARKVYFEKILPVQDCLKAIGKPVPVVKYALELRGFPVGEARKPLSPLSEKQKKAVRKTLEAIGVL